MIHEPPGAEVLAAVTRHDPALAELVGRCLDKDPSRRPGQQQIVDAARAHARAASWPALVAYTRRARESWADVRSRSH